MPPFDSQAIMCEQFVLRQVFATSWFSDESVRTVGSQSSVRPVGSHPSVSDQLVPRRVCVTS